MGPRAFRYLSLLTALSLVSLGLQGPLATATPSSQGGLHNLATASYGATAWATTFDAAHEPQQAIDGRADTAWWATTTGSLYVDFPRERAIREVHLHLHHYTLPKVELELRDGAGGYHTVQTWNGDAGMELVYATKGEIVAHGLRISFPEPLRHTHSYIHRHCPTATPLVLGLGNVPMSFCYDHLHYYQDEHFARVGEVEAWGPIPDEDGDGLSDDDEVAGWEVVVTKLGARTRYWVTSDPLQADADEDGLTDLEERNMGTDPGLWDTDGDGEWDDEDLGPLNDDMDWDGLPDGLDRVPDGVASLSFKTRFPPGFVKFRQPFSVFSLEGQYAWVYNYNYPYGVCQFTSDETAAATRSSVIDAGKVLAEIQRTFTEGGEMNYVPTRAEHLYEQGTTYHQFTYGGCDFWSPKQYKIGYSVPEDKWGVDFVNVEEVEVPDGFGGKFQFALERIPVRPGHPISLVLQYTLPTAADWTSYEGLTSFRIGAMGYKVYGSGPGAGSPLFANAAMAVGLTNGAYQLELRIPGSVTAQAPLDSTGRPFLRILMLPFWLDVKPYAVNRLAWDVSAVTWAAMSLEVPIFVHQVIARLSVDLEDLEAVLPEDMEGFNSGLYTFGSYGVYVHGILGDSVFNPGILEQMDAIVLVGTSESDVIAAREAIDWGLPGTWYQEGADAFNLGLKWFSTGSRIGQISIRFLEFRDVAKVLLDGKVEFPAIPIQPNERGPTFTIEKLMVNGQVVFRQIRWTSADTYETIYGVRKIIEVRKPVQVGYYERVEDIPALKNRHATMRSALRGAAIGAVLVTWGRTGILAFVEGDIVKGSVYTSATSTAVFGTLWPKAELSKLGFDGRLGRITVGKIATAAVGTIFASYNLYLASRTSDSIVRSSYMEQASAWTIDTGIMIASPYGFAAVLAWGMTISIMSAVIPNSIAASVTSTPGSFVTFILEYIFSGVVPSGIAEDAFDLTTSWAISQMRQWNGVFHIPSIVVLPQK